MCHFCLHTCSNDDYTYCHLAAIHLNIQWGFRTCYGYVSGYLLKIREHVQSHLKKSSRGRSRSSHKKSGSRQSDSSSDGVSSNEDWSAGNWERRRTMVMMKSPVPPVTRLARTPQISSRVPTQASSLLEQTSAGCPMSLGVEYQGTA